MEDYRVVGRIGKPHGLKGEVSVEPRTDEPDRRFAVGARLGVERKRPGRQDDQTYTVATNDYLARGGNDYTAFKAAKPLQAIDDSPLLANAVMVYLRKLGTVRNIAGGRLVQK